jgi:hypothetical protein
MPDVQPIDWKAVYSAIREGRPALANILDNFINNGPSDSSYSCFIAKYSYGERVLVDGKPVIPWDLSKQILTEKHGHYLGIIKAKAFERFSFAQRRETKTEMSHDILVPGMIIGAVDLYDMIQHARISPFARELPQRRNYEKNQWQISSGARTVELLFDIRTKGIRDKFERTLNQSIGYLKGFDVNALDALGNLRVFGEIAEKWHGEIVFLSVSWLSDLVRRKDEAAEKLRRYIIREAEKVLVAHESSKPDQLRSVLLAAAGFERSEYVNIAADILTGIGNVLARRLVFYVPMRSDDQLGPFGQLSAALLRPLGQKKYPDVFMIPAQASSQIRSGFLRTENLAAALVSAGRDGNIKLRIQSAIDILNRVMTVHNKNIDMQKYFDPSMFNFVLFKTPVGVHRWHPSYVGENIHKLDRADMEAVSGRKAFYEGFSSEDFIFEPSDRCHFFRNSVRIDFRAPSARHRSDELIDGAQLTAANQGASS